MVLNGSGAASGGGFNNSRTNPAPLANPGGGVTLTYRGGSKGYRAEYIGLATADQWPGPYTVQTEAPILPDNLEDPFVYRDCRGGYHMLAHAVGPAARGGQVGVHAYSADGVSWTMAKPATAYNTTVQWSDGSVSTLARRERPVLVFGTDNSGCNVVPVALINGALNRSSASLRGFSDTPTFTLIQPVLSIP